MLPISPNVFRAYDIRGRVDTDFDPEWVQTFGRACGTVFRRHGQRQCVVGHDCRHSSPTYNQSLITGLMAAGMDVTALGMVPTPVFYYAVSKLGRQAGIIVTASHNPPDYNGFKIWHGRTTMHTEALQEVYRTMATGDFAADQGSSCELDIVPAYLEELCTDITLSRPVKIVVDGGNGAGGEICAQLLQKAGAEVVPLHCTPDGAFPNHHPDPTVADNLLDLQQTVRREHADFGVGLDGDADRLGVVDAQGTPLYGDQLLALFARDLLARRPGATVIGEVKCSHLLYEDIAAHGGTPLMWKTGHSLIKAKMQETGALLAGEMSGHMFFADRYYGFDDALYAALRLAHIVDRTPETPLGRLLDDWPPTHNTPEIRVPCPEEHTFRIVDMARENFRDQGLEINEVDGVRIEFGDGWGLIRASNTQPVLVLRFEAQSAERLQQIRSHIETPLQRWITELSPQPTKETT
ncbi:MAG: phosphomannomutase/phosphoglucomutase [Thermodesulfobacteriota bacterium]